jgi:hypothetical protein
MWANLEISRDEAGLDIANMGRLAANRGGDQVLHAASLYLDLRQNHDVPLSPGMFYQGGTSDFLFVVRGLRDRLDLQKQFFSAQDFIVFWHDRRDFKNATEALDFYGISTSSFDRVKKEVFGDHGIDTSRDIRESGITPESLGYMGNSVRAFAAYLLQYISVSRSPVVRAACAVGIASTLI